MQNDKELSFRIYSAGAAQKPNRLELEDGELVGLFNLLLGILLGAFDTLAGEEGESGKTERSLVAGELGSGGGHGAHFISNCFFTEPRNAVLLKAKRPARSTYISAMPFVDSIHGRPSHACATTAAAHLPASDTSGQVSLYSTDWDTNADELNPLAISHTPMDISHKPPGIV